MSDWLYTFIESIQIVCFSKMILIWLFSKKIYYILYIYIFNINMSIENPERLERLERTEAYLKQRLSEYKSVMPVKGWDGVTLLEIYWEWMEYLVKENLKKRENPKKRNNFIEKWRRFLLEYNTDAIADLLIGFFDAKRRYGRDMGRGEDKWDWFALCKNYCNKNGWHGDEDFLYSLFSSYSWAERRIYRKVEKGKVLSSTSRSILQIIDLTKAEMIRKEEEKKRRMEEKLKKAEDRKRREEERQKIKEEKLKTKAEKQRKKEWINKKMEGKQGYWWEIENEILGFVDAWAENHYWGDDRDIVEGWDVVFNPKYEHIPVEDPGVPEGENNTVIKGSEPKKEESEILKKGMEIEENVQENDENEQRKEPRQLEIPFEDLE